MLRRPSRNKPTKLTEYGLGRLGALIILVVWFSLLGLALINRQNIQDWWRLRNYQEPADIAQLASQDTMTAYAQKVFEVNRPAIDDKSSFAKTCPNNSGERTVLVLGCYHSDQAGIFLLGVSDPRLNGVEQVTAAHEMLHAAYDRLSSSERKKVDAMLTDYYQHGLKDARVRSTIDDYKKSEPNDVVNEMHSVFGTEVANLPSGLENYYSRYFTDRSKVTEFAASYESEFTSRQAAAANYNSQLTSLKSQIDNMEADLKSKQTSIDSQQANLVSLKNAGKYSAYNAGVPGYNALIDAYNAEVDSVKNLINQYNTILANLKAVALEEDQLVQELSTNVKQINH